MSLTPNQKKFRQHQDQVLNERNHENVDPLDTGYWGKKRFSPTIITFGVFIFIVMSALPISWLVGRIAREQVDKSNGMHLVDSQSKTSSTLPILKTSGKGLQPVPNYINKEILELKKFHTLVKSVPIFDIADSQVPVVLNQVAQVKQSLWQVNVREDLFPSKEALYQYLQYKEAALISRQNYLRTGDTSHHDKANQYVTASNSAGQSYLTTLAQYFDAHGYRYKLNGQGHLEWSYRP